MSKIHREVGGPLPVSVQLLDHTQRPIETLYTLWEAARHNQHILAVDEVAKRMRLDAAFFEKVIEQVSAIIESKLPITENIFFTFLLENISIELREQLVRHRIGVKVGDRLGCDFVPDIHDSTWWSQSMRVLDMGNFAEEGRYRIPESVEGNEGARDIYLNAMRECQQAYRELTRMGVPFEDARGVIPLSTTHRISWTLNLSALMHIIGKRCCWILQLGIWEPIIQGMAQHLKTISPIFTRLTQPPCLKQGSWGGSCWFVPANERRISGDDLNPPCPLYLFYCADSRRKHEKSETAQNAWHWSPEDHRRWFTKNGREQVRFFDMISKYQTLWGIPLDHYWQNATH